MQHIDATDSKVQKVKEQRLEINSARKNQKEKQMVDKQVAHQEKKKEMDQLRKEQIQ